MTSTSSIKVALCFLKVCKVRGLKKLVGGEGKRAFLALPQIPSRRQPISLLSRHFCPQTRCREQSQHP